MKQCPIDHVDLIVVERNGVEIDYCPVCRGVWLDRGELDKIIERSVPQQAAAQPAPTPQQAAWDRDDRRDYRDDRYDDRRDRRRPKRRESFLSEIFDFEL